MLRQACYLRFRRFDGIGSRGGIQAGRSGLIATSTAASDPQNGAAEEQNSNELLPPELRMLKPHDGRSGFSCGGREGAVMTEMSGISRAGREPRKFDQLASSAIGPAARRHRLLASIGMFVVPLGLTAMSPDAGRAESCGEQIARLEAAQSAARVVPYARQSVAAQMHRQPTPGSVATAESEAQRNFDAALAGAKKLNAEGKEAECIAALEKAGVPPGAR